MRYVAAYLLAQLGGNGSPSATNIKSILGSVGIEAEDDRVAALLKEVSGKDVKQLISAGSTKLASMPAAGGVSAAPAAAAASAAAPAAADQKAAAKAPPKQESEEEDMGFGLFD